MLIYFHFKIIRSKNEKLIILIDNGEKDSKIPDLLKKVPILFENLEIGDLIIERKTSKDFIASIFDGRIFK
jgi:ERCC4-type nuclease